MSPPTRVAGWGTGAFGSVVTWTVAEGRKGRRWREVVSRGTAVIHALMLGTDPDQQFSRIRSSPGRTGCWTFHPEPNGTSIAIIWGKKPGVRRVEGGPSGVTTARS